MQIGYKFVYVFNQEEGGRIFASFTTPRSVLGLRLSFKVRFEHFLYSWSRNLTDDDLVP
jgi:hypothetical protein